MTNDLNSGRTPWRLAGIFVAMVLGISIAGRVYYVSQREQIKQEKQSQLVAIADLKVGQISQWRDERIADGKSIAENPFLLECLSAIRENQRTRSNKARLRNWMRSLGEHYGYERVELLDPVGKLLVEEGGEAQIGSIETILVSQAVKSRNVVFSDLHRESFNDHIHCDVVVPTSSAATHSSTVVAVVLLRVDASQFLYPLVQSWPTFSKSSEVLLVERDGDQILYLNELRHLKNTPLMFRKPMSDLQLLGAKAVSDSEGVAEGIDYRGVAVLGALKKIPNSPWRLIAKVDQEEVYAPIQERSQMVSIVVIILIMVAGLGMGLLWRHQRSHFDLTVEPLRNEKGDIVGITGATLDITNRKRAEEQLQLQKAYFQQLFESAPEGIVLLASNERIIEVNREFTKLFGYTQQDAVGCQINELIVPDMYKDEGHTLSRRVAQGSIISTESIRRRKDGSLVDVSILGRPVRVDGGQIALYAIYRDITDRKKSEEALRKSEFSFRGLFNSVNDAIYIQDREGRFVDVNQGAVNMYGYPRQYFVGKNPSDLSAPGKNDLAKAVELVNKAFEGEPQQFEFWGIRKNGEIFPKEVRVSKGTYFGQEVVIALAQDITERKRFEAVLQETNRTLESLIKASPLAITVMDQECNIQLWNPAAERMFGWKADEVIGAFNPIVPEDKRDEFIELHNRALKGETISELEVRRKKRDGTLIDINRSTAIIRDSDGNVKGIMAVLADITERKRAEEQLRESEERLRLALTGANMMSWELDLLTERVTWSESAERFYGLEPDEFHGTREAFVRLIHPDDRSAVEQGMNDSIQGGKEYKEEFRIVWPDGTVHWLAAFGRASRDELGRPVKVSGIGVDITDRKRTEETIQKLHHAVEQTDEVIIMTEPDGIITYVNPAFEKLYRYSREEVIGKTPRVLKSGGMNQEYYARFWHDLLAGKSIRAEHINKTKDGRIVIVEASVNSVYDVKGKLTGFIAVQEDISDRKRNESERKRLEAQLLQTQKLESIGTLAGGIAHDFNNILGIILAYSALLRNARLPFEKIVNAADVINQAVERGAELVKQILTFARKTDVIYGLVNINGMIKELKTMVSETFPRTITIAAELGGDVPEITADATQVHQAILNICVNARDAMPAGGKLILRTHAGSRSEVSSYFPEATSERYVRVSISDTGAGMDESTRQRIFEPFFTTKAKGKGTGLGLSVVYGVVKNHNGFVRVDSEIGRGTTFHLYFPAPIRFVQPVEKTQGSLVDIPGGSESILIVEDEEPLLNVLSGLLKSKGYRVYVAHDGFEAVETYEEHRNDIAVVVSDLGLPKMTGQDAFLRMKSVNPRVKVIFGTGYLDPELKTELLNLGAKGFLAKPYSQDELLKRIRDLIDSDT